MHFTASHQSTADREKTGIFMQEYIVAVQIIHAVYIVAVQLIHAFFPTAKAILHFFPLIPKNEG